MDKKMMVYSGTFIALTVLSRLFGTVEAMFYRSMNVFIEGYSPIRVYIILCWIAFLFLLCSLPWRIDLRRFSSRLVFITMIATFAVGLSTQIWFNHKFDIGAGDLALVVNGGEMTGTAITHNHLTKDFFGSIIYPLVPSFESLDPGTGADSFIPVLPRVLFIISFTLFLISIVLYLVNRLKSIEREKYLYIIGFGLLTGLIIIRTIDGGILSANTLLFIGLFCAVLNTKSVKSFWYISSGALIIQLGWYMTFSDFIASTIDDIYPYLLTAFISWCVIILLMGGAYIGNHRVKAVSLYIMGGLCIVSSLVYVSHIIRAEKNSELSTETAYIATYKKTDSPTYIHLGDINMLAIYKYSGMSKKVSELIRDQHTLARFNPVSIPGRTCTVSDVAHVSAFRLLSVEPVSDMQKPEIGLSFAVKSIESPLTHLFAYRAVLISPPCLPRHLSVLQETIITAGAKHFIISERR